MVFSHLQILLGFLLPPAVVLGVGAVAWRFLGDARWVFAVLIAGGFAGAYRVVEPGLGWPPTGNVLYLFFYFALAAGVLTVADGLVRPRMWVRLVVLVLVWRMVVRVLVARQVPTAMSASDAEMWIDFSSLVVVMWWLAFERIAERAPGVTTPILLAAMSAASAIVLALGWHIQSSGALAGVLTLMCLAGVAVSLISRRAAFSRGFAQVVVLILQLLLVHGYFYTDDTLTGAQQAVAAGLMATPLLALAGEIGFVQRRRPVLRLAIRVAPALIVLGVICAATVRGFLKAEQTSAAMQDE
jgi:hypothetical protein